MALVDVRRWGSAASPRRNRRSPLPVRVSAKADEAGEPGRGARAARALAAAPSPGRDLARRHGVPADFHLGNYAMRLLSVEATFRSARVIESRLSHTRQSFRVSIGRAYVLRHGGAAAAVTG